LHSLLSAVEAGGHRHPDLTEFIKRFFRASCGDDVKTYVYKIKAPTQRVSVALRRTTSRALMEMERRAKACPSVAVGVAQLPP
jgi:hypothetical protein